MSWELHEPKMGIVIEGAIVPMMSVGIDSTSSILNGQTGAVLALGLESAVGLTVQH